MMTYDSLTNKYFTKKFKASTYKKHIIENIEIIGQRKIVILGDGHGINALILKKVIEKLRAKGVRVPQIAYIATNDERTLSDDVRSITTLNGMAKTYYVMISSSSDPLEVYLKGLTRKVGTAKSIAQRLEQYGYTNRDYCIMNEPTFALAKHMSIMNFSFKMSNKKEISRLDKIAKKTEEQLLAIKDKCHGQRCFIIGYKKGARIEELNVMFNEKCISYNGICNFFARTPLRPTQYILTDPKHYLGNGKYIENMDSFISSSVKVFEDKFKNKPTFFNIMGKGFIPQLPSFESTQHSESLCRIDDLYIALQLALYQGFSEIYIYGFDGIYNAQITNYDEALVNESKEYDYPSEAQALLKKVKTYANSCGTSIYNMSGISSLDMFERKNFDDVDFSITNILSKI